MLWEAIKMKNLKLAKAGIISISINAHTPSYILMESDAFKKEYPVHQSGEHGKEYTKLFTMIEGIEIMCLVRRTT